MSFLSTYFALRLSQRHNRKSTERRFARQFTESRQEKRVAEHRTVADVFKGTYGQPRDSQEK